MMLKLTCTQSLFTSLSANISNASNKLQHVLDECESILQQINSTYSIFLIA